MFNLALSARVSRYVDSALALTSYRFEVGTRCSSGSSSGSSTKVTEPVYTL